MPLIYEIVPFFSDLPNFCSKAHHNLYCLFFYATFFLVTKQQQFINKVNDLNMLVSGAQQSESVIHIHVSTLF